MADITIGEDAINRGSTWPSGWTVLSQKDPASENFNVTSVEIWANTNLSGVKIGSFSGADQNRTGRDFVTIGDVTAGSKQTFTLDSSSDPISIEFQTGDVIGIFYSGGSCERDLDGYAGVWYKSGDNFTGFNSYLTLAGDALSFKGIAVAAGFTRKIKIGGTFADKPIKVKVAGTFEDKPIKIKVGGTFQDA